MHVDSRRHCLIIATHSNGGQHGEESNEVQDQVGSEEAGSEEDRQEGVQEALGHFASAR